MTTLQVTGRKGEWYIHDPQARQEDCGPYSTREDAESDARGLDRFWRNWKPSTVKPAPAPAGLLF